MVLVWFSFLGILVNMKIIRLVLSVIFFAFMQSCSDNELVHYGGNELFKYDALHKNQFSVIEVKRMLSEVSDYEGKSFIDFWTGVTGNYIDNKREKEQFDKIEYEHEYKNSIDLLSNICEYVWTISSSTSEIKKVNILDVGGNNGVFLIPCLLFFPNTSLTICDIQGDGFKVFENLCKTYNIASNRYRTIKCDFLEMKAKIKDNDKFDVIYCGNVLHSFTNEKLCEVSNLVPELSKDIYLFSATNTYLPQLEEYLDHNVIIGLKSLKKNIEERIFNIIFLYDDRIVMDSFSEYQKAPNKELFSILCPNKTELARSVLSRIVDFEKTNGPSLLSEVRGFRLRDLVKLFDKDECFHKIYYTDSMTANRISKPNGVECYSSQFLTINSKNKIIRQILGFGVCK